MFLIILKLGDITISYEDELVKTIPIYLDEDLHFDFLKYIMKHYEYAIAGGVVLIGGSAILIKTFKAKRKKI